MREMITWLIHRFARRRGVGEDTRRLPSLVKAMTVLVPRSVLKEVVASSHDRRQWGVLAAAWVGVSEREFVSAAARELGMPYQDHVAVPDLTVFGSQARAMLLALRKVGAMAQLQGDRIVGFIAADPAEIRGLDFYDGTHNISMAPWTEIAKALDSAERLLAEAEANVDRTEALRRRDLCERVVSILISEAMQHGAISVEILSSDGKNRYQFTTPGGKVAVGTIQKEALESVLLHLNTIEGGAFAHHAVGQVLVRALGSASNIRLSWVAKQEIPKELPWNEDESRIADSSRAVVEKRSEEVRPSENEVHESDGAIPVLVIDDNPMFCRVLERLLRRDNFEVSFAENGEEALDRLLELVSFLPKVIICDLHMPKMNGREFVCRLKEDSRLKHIPVVMLTSDDGVDAELSMLEVGADALISKSKDPRVLCAQVARLAKGNGLREAA